jgi:AcrR family transcriptional regulator
MRPTKTKKIPARAPARDAQKAPSAEPEREPRGARRKRETRERLLDAAFRLMAERGRDGVAIQEITEAADVGAGSFYNHFESKEDIYLALIASMFEEYGATLDRRVAGLSDPAEIVAASVRHTVRRAAREPLWGRLLIREGLSGSGPTRGLGMRLLRDVQGGMAAGRFKVADPMISYLAVGGAVMAAVSAAVELDKAGPAERMAASTVGLSSSDLAERIAAVVLRMLGLTQAQSELIARRPLPAADPIPELT